MKTKTIFKTTAVTLALTMAFTAAPVISSGAKAKAPALNKKSISLLVGEKQKLTVKKNGNKIKKITWSSKNKEIASVSKKGVVKGVAGGKTKVTAKVVTKSGTNKLPCKVKVEGSMEENQWLTAKDASVEGGVAKLFETLNKNTDGATLDPVATLAYRVSNDGTTWRVLARQTMVIPNAVTHYVIAEVNESMDGSVNLVDVYPSSVTAASKEGEAASGGWTECTDPNLTKDEKADFEKATEGLVGVLYTPVAKIATQVVAGIRYLFICEATPITVLPEIHYSIITVTVPVSGDVTVDQIENIEVPDDSKGADTFGGGNWYYRGGYNKPASPEIDETLAAFFKAATGDLSKDATYTPVALLGERENDGQDFMVFSRCTPTRPGAKTRYSIIEFHTTLIGQSILTDIIDTSIEAFGTDPTTGWAQNSTPVLAKGEEQIFNEAVKGLTGVKTDPLAILGTRKMRGTDYCFIAEITTVTENPDHAYVLIYASAAEDGKVTCDSIINLLNA